MAFITWTSKMSVGVEKLDNDHQKLISYINQLHEGLTSGLGISDMTYILGGLASYAVGHFANEETLMRDHSYQSIADHLREHKAFLKKVQDFQLQLQSGRKSFSLELMSFLSSWLVNHVMNTDMQYKLFFNKKGIK
jgi:hemerythrin-like metal-binding protein